MKTVWMVLGGHEPPQLVAVGDGVRVGVGDGVSDGEGEGVGIGDAAQPLIVHASQQLVAALTQAVPPRGARQRLAPRLIRQTVVPVKLVRQHGT